jgi:hypothetical protein
MSADKKQAELAELAESAGLVNLALSQPLSPLVPGPCLPAPLLPSSVSFRLQVTNASFR